MSRTLLIMFLAFATLGACSSLQNEILYRSQDLSAFEESATPDLHVTPEDYRRALKRWPWIEDNQLRRRALILALRPSPAQLETLSANSTAVDELALINELTAKRYTANVSP